MATKMAGRLTVQDGAQIAARCILWSDKAVFHTGGFVNRHNCHYWVAHDPELTVEKMQNRPKVTVWCGMTAARFISAYLLRDTMNVKRYLQMLEDYVWPIVYDWENVDELVFMHDGTCLVGSEVSGTLAGRTRTSRMACNKSRSHTP